MESGRRGAQRFLGAPTEFVDPIDVAVERTLKLSKLSVSPEFWGVLCGASKLPEGRLVRSCRETIVSILGPAEGGGGALRFFICLDAMFDEATTTENVT